MKDPQFYRLNKNNEVVPCNSTALGKWIRTDSNEHILGHEKVGRFLISTVFMGVDKNLFSEIPAYFETMVFDNGEESNIFPVSHYETYRQALQGHALKLEDVKQYISNSD